MVQLRGVQLVMLPTNQVFPLRRAIVIVFGYFTIKSNGFVKGSGNLGDEVGAFLFLHVFAGTVGKHLQGCFEDGVHSHLVYTCTLTHGVVVDGAEQGTGGIYHSSRRIVHRTGELAQIGAVTS